MPFPIMPPQPIKSTCALGDAVTYLPEITKGKPATQSVCKILVCRKASNPSSRDACMWHLQRSISQRVKAAPGCCLDRRAAAKCQPPLESGCRTGSVQEGLDRGETTLLAFEYIPPAFPNTQRKQEIDNRHCQNMEPEVCEISARPARDLQYTHTSLNVLLQYE